MAKLIVTGRDRTQALERSRRALAEFVVDGMPTVVPFHRAVVVDPAFVGEPAEDPTGFGVYTQWIETEFDNRIEPYGGDAAQAAEAGERRTVVVEVGGRRLEVVVPADLGGDGTGGSGGSGGRGSRPRRAAGSRSGSTVSGDSVTSPMQGTVVKVVVTDGQEVAEGETIVVIEAMKMEQAIKAHKAGTVGGLSVEVGGSLTNGEVVCELTD